MASLEFPFPFVGHGPIRKAVVDEVASALTLMLQALHPSQMELASSLCNALSLTLQAMTMKAASAEDWKALLSLEEHLQHVVNVLGYKRRNHA